MGNTNKQSRTYPVNEIFAGIQGEGFWTGMPAVFIRFAGCNLDCEFCDTDYSVREMLSLRSILKRVEAMLPRTVILTGGEPLMQPLEPLLKEFKSRGLRIHLETNGTYPVPEGFIDWIVVSPKISRPAVKQCHELRILLAEGEIPHDRGIQADHYFVSPLNPPDGNRINQANLRYCIDYVLMHPRWRLSVQLHKYLDIP